ncbi:MAG: hypothetical protein R2824_03475 [Saprospiraceae bacterium]|nr:hypothetical protein [Lewinella sp.]
MKALENIRILFSWQVSSTHQHRLLLWGGHIFFLLLFLLSLVYYQERLLSLDAANYAFHLVLGQDFYTGQGRVITYLTQILPLLSVKSGWSLKAVLMIYSASFILYYYLVYVLITHLFRNPQAGIFLALSLCLSMRYKFYGPVGEVVLSIGLLALLIGWITRPSDRFGKLPVWADLGIGMALASLLFTGHPFIAVSTAIFFGFELIHRDRWKEWPFWVLSIYTGLILFLKMKFDASNEYTQMRLNRLSDVQEVITNLPDLYITDRLLWFFETEYAFPFTIFLLSLVWIWIRGKKWLSLYLFAAFWGLTGLILLMHNYLSGPIYIMLDGYLSHLGVLWALPIAFCCLPERRWWMLVLVGVLLLFGLDRIRNKHRFFRERIEYLQAIMDKNAAGDQRKLLAHMDQFDWNKLWMPWAVGFETLLISSLDGPEGSTTIYFQQPHENWDEQLDDPNFFLSLHYAPIFVKQEWLNSRYFHLPPGPYKKINIER